MANGVYLQGLQELWAGTTALETDTLVMLLMQSSYAFDTTEQFISDLSDEISAAGYSRQTLANQAIGFTGTSFVFLSADALAFGSIATGQTIGSAVLARQTGSDASSPLLAFYEFTPTPTTGAAVTATPATAANGGVLQGRSA